MATLFERLGCLDKLEAFISTFGRAFYQLPAVSSSDPRLVLKRKVLEIPESYTINGSTQEADVVVPFMAKQELAWQIYNGC
ncbi:dihydroorotase [Coemansia sp. S155-1]|nr:dihydroorotase [Coemansia sp. S155-1]